MVKAVKELYNDIGYFIKIWFERKLNIF
jgi:hypothetical protein